MLKRRNNRQSPSSDEEFSSEFDDSAKEQELPITPGTVPPIPRTGHVSQQLQKQIRKGEFVKFESLLTDQPGSKQPKFRVNLETGSFDKVEDKQRLTFYQWINAFTIYMSIRIQGRPDETQGLLRHMQIVQQLQTQGKDAIGYDRQFRLLKVQHPNIQWGEYFAEIVDSLPLTTQMYPVGQPGKIGYRKSRPFSTPFRYSDNNKSACYAFNSQRGCRFTSCRYTHKCSSCGKIGHSVIDCKSFKPKRA